MLDYCHLEGIIHRDAEPHNVIIIHVTDFLDSMENGSLDGGIDRNCEINLKE